MLTETGPWKKRKKKEITRHEEFTTRWFQNECAGHEIFVIILIIIITIYSPTRGTQDISSYVEFTSLRFKKELLATRKYLSLEPIQHFGKMALSCLIRHKRP